MTQELEPDDLTLFPSSQPRAMTPGEEEQIRVAQRLTPDERLQGLLNVEQLREQLDQGKTARYIPSRPCPRCGALDGEIGRSGNQLPVSCRVCGTKSYNAPRLEVGFEQRTVANLRDGISAGRRARILDRDHARCVLCGCGGELVVGHLLSLADGEKVGATREELDADVNLAAMCETCNAGLGQRSISLLTFTLMLHLLRAEDLPRQSRSLKR